MDSSAKQQQVILYTVSKINKEKLVPILLNSDRIEDISYECRLLARMTMHQAAAFGFAFKFGPSTAYTKNDS